MHIKTIKIKKSFRIYYVLAYKFGAFGLDFKEAFEIPFVTLNLFVTDCWLLNII